MRATLQLILWPTIFTLTVNIARLVLEVQGVITTQSGGGLALLGITWLIFVFGAWFGGRLSKSGSRPRLRWSVLWAVLPLIAIVTAVAMGLGAIERADQSAAADEQLRSAVLTIIIVAIVGAAFCFVIWSRLALTMLLYAIPARLTVIAMTWLAKMQGWDTHYTKFGPSGTERDLGETIFAASVAQLGFWIAFSIIGGVLVGTVAARMLGPRPA